MTALWQLLRQGRGHRRRLVLAAFLAALTYLCAVALMGVAAWLISRAAEHPEASALTLAAVAVRALGLGRGLARYAERLVGHDAALKAVADLRVAVFQSLVRRDDAHRRSGAVLSSVVADVDAVQDLWLRCVLPLGAAVLVAAASVVAVWWWLPLAGLALLVGLGAALVVVPLLSSVAAHHEATRSERRADYQVQALDVVQGCADLQVFGALPDALADAQRAAEGLAVVERGASLRAGWVSGVATLLQGATTVVVAMAGLAAVQDGRLPRVGLAVVVLVALAAFEPVLPLVDAGALLRRSVGAARRLAALLEPGSLAREERRPMGTTLVPDDVLAAQDLRVRYEGSGGLALDGVDLELRQGCAVVLVGRSGAGKSTLLRALAGALPAVGGEALLGSARVQDLTGEVLAQHVVLAEQDAHLFHASLRDNLLLARPDASQDELEAAAVEAGLDAWIAGLPKGWDTTVGEHGAQLSGGERKRLSVARALLSKARYLLLDEPTEGLDPVAADALVRRLLTAHPERGVLLVTHRIAAIEAADEVVTLEAGRVVGRTTPAQLAG